MTRTDAAQSFDPAQLPWIPLGIPGMSFKPLRFLPDDGGWEQLLRLEPGVVIPRHRHTGPVFALNLEGQRKLLDTGAVVGPGGYVYEPAGNVDTWAAVGEVPLLVHVTVLGAIEYVDADGKVTDRKTSATQREVYRQFCEKNGLRMLDLGA